MIEKKQSAETVTNQNLKKENLFVIKIGGNVIDDDKALLSFLQDFSTIPAKKILVHGGGKIATLIGDKLGIQSKYIDGRRITDDETIGLVTMVYGGLVNKKIVAALQSISCNAVGLSGADANVMPAVKRPVKEIDYGWVGNINAADVNPATWQLFLDNGLVPVLAPLTHDSLGNMLNTNADTMAAVLSVALAKCYNVKLLYCFEKNGVLENVDNDAAVISRLDANIYRELKESKKLFAGILPKIDNAFLAINNGVGEVVIGNSSNLPGLINGELGTKISG
ncbi:MAG: acetylglutamate kinase [Bacteroidota bacterium]|nr:acetylglutamate kinase [Bacteroidota bacterium]